MDSEVLKQVIDDMRKREAKGKTEYGTTLDRKDLSENDWMDYAYEEALDLSLYLKKIILNRTDKVY
jgi:electron transfer flavoprotein alpha/beta subunit